MSDILMMSWVENAVRLERAVYDMLTRQAKEWYGHTYMEISALYRGKRERYQIHVDDIFAVTTNYDPDRDAVGIIIRLSISFDGPEHPELAKDHTIAIPGFADENGVLTANYDYLGDRALEYWKRIYHSAPLHQTRISMVCSGRNVGG